MLGSNPRNVLLRHAILAKSLFQSTLRFTLPYPTLPYSTLPYPALPYPVLPYPTLPAIQSSGGRILKLMPIHHNNYLASEHVGEFTLHLRHQNEDHVRKGENVLTGMARNLSTLHRFGRSSPESSPPPHVTDRCCCCCCFYGALV